MCGLVGMAGNLNTNHNKMFRDMLLFDTVRGWDSTGVAFVGMADKAEVVVQKEVGGPSNLWDWGHNDLLNYKGISKTVNKVMIGHNRAATVGVVNSDNAHPFTYGHITGAHNGSLTDWRDLEGYVELDVDSKAVFNTISKKGIDHTWKNFLGAAALTWWDAEQGTINLVRNEQRPLFVTWSKKGDAIFWASEKWMIEVAASRANVDLRDKPEGQDAIIQLKPHSLHTFTPTTMTCPLTEVRTLEKKNYPTTVRNTQTCGGAHGGNTTHSKTRVYQPRKSPSRSAGKFINSMWGQGLEKADKSLRGEVVCLDSHYSFSGHFPDTKYVVVFNFEDGRVLEAYPNSKEEYDAWVERTKSKHDMYYTIMSRPRVFTDSAGRLVCYKICDKGLKLQRTAVQRQTSPNEVLSITDMFPQQGRPEGEVINLVKGWNGAITEASWKRAGERMSPKCSCAICASPLEMSEHKEIQWLGPTTAACPTCSKDDNLISQLTLMQHG